MLNVNLRWYNSQSIEWTSGGGNHVRSPMITSLFLFWCANPELGAQAQSPVWNHLNEVCWNLLWILGSMMQILSSVVIDPTSWEFTSVKHFRAFENWFCSSNDCDFHWAEDPGGTTLNEHRWSAEWNVLNTSKDGLFQTAKISRKKFSDNKASKWY